MARIVAPALRALLGGLIDYAGMFPPALLSREAGLARYGSYRSSTDGWVLGRFVISAADLEDLPTEIDYKFAVLSNVDNARAELIESKVIVSTPKPTYCEVPIGSLDALKKAGSFAKIRTGGITPGAIPSVQNVSDFILSCAERKLPFKATAGLHHPIRSKHNLTYEPDAPFAMMHGFINVFLAASFAWHGEQHIRDILAETDPTAFRFDGRAHWRDLSISSQKIAEARENFAHSFGSCSFEEPMEDLRRIGWL